MKYKQSRSRGFTLIELLVVITIIGILAALVIPSVGDALVSASLLKGANNAEEIFRAAQNASNDALKNGNYTVAMPLDMTTPPADMLEYANDLKNNGFLNDFRNLTADTVPTAGVTLTTANIAFSLAIASSSSPPNTVFITSKNFSPCGGGSLVDYVPPTTGAHTNAQGETTPQADPNNPPATTENNSGQATPGPSGVGGGLVRKPYGNKGFVVCRLGGDVGSYRPKDTSVPQGPPGVYLWGLDPTKATPAIKWAQTGD